MKNSDFDYSYHHSVWHEDTAESRKFDIANAKGEFDLHNIYPKSKDGKVLEVGCGLGRVLLMLKDKGYSDLTGIDIDKSQIDIAKKDGLNVHLSDAVEFLKGSGNLYDVVYCFDILEHIEKERQLDFLRLLNTHLSADGFMVIRVPNASAPLGLYYRHIDYTHVIAFTDYSLKFLLYNAAFRFTALRPQNKERESIRRLKMPWANLYRYEMGLGNDFILTLNIMAICFKEEEPFRRYLAETPIIRNDYTFGYTYRKKKIKSAIKKFFKSLFQRKNT
jgi:2-polyprenyl-3-methyl-5-hydroxy-6-metoxy-1,4-benzoquinol methylase